MKYLHNLKKIYQIKTHLSESGRSMVEMLGVLAVVGVLSIAGIMGYSYAMNRYRANDILNEVNMRGEDIWNRYQKTVLPKEIDEWATVTQTGYPIRIKTIPDNIEPWFQVVVSDVSPDVCKLVLMNQYDSILARVSNSGTVQTYTGDVSICNSTTNANVDLIFVWALNSDTSKTKPDNDLIQTPCVSNNDCASCEWCNTGKYGCEANCPNERPVCSHDKQECVECAKTADCPVGQICSNLTNQCETPIEKCSEGEFRSKNGACVPCDYAGNVEIDKDNPFTFGDITDEQTGAESCSSCAGVGSPRKMESNATTTYCSYACTIGFSYQSSKNGCISCEDTDDYSISNEAESKQLCLACSSNHTIYASGVTNGPSMCGVATCETGYFKSFITSGNFGGDTSRSYCTACSSNRNERVTVTRPGAMSSSISERFINLCNNCPNTPEQARFYYKSSVIDSIPDNLGYCYPKCIQPDEGNSITTCKEEGPESTNCIRQFQDQKTGNCLPCNSASNVYVGTSGPFYDACLNCGRTVNSLGYCILKTEICDPGYFREYGTDKCKSCSDTKWVRIVDDETSGCTSQCKKNEKGEYDVNGTIDTKWIVETQSNKKSYKTFCADKCSGEGIQFQDVGGNCINCSVKTAPHVLYIDGGAGTSIQLQNLCSSCEEMKTVHGGSICGIKNCDKNQFHDYRGICVSCSNSSSYTLSTTDEVSTNECKACPNRILTSNGKCVYIKNGVSGICNSVENGEHENYPAGNGVYFRDNNGYCQSCQNENNYTTTQAQCNSCGNRRYSNGSCQIGLCTTGSTFLNKEATCVACTDTSNRVEIPINSVNFCSACSNKRVITYAYSDETEMALCVPDCAGTQWQTLDGKCRTCFELGDSVNEIGSDSRSKTQCTDCGRVVYSKTNKTVTKWYCSQYAEEGEHFINTSGEKVGCNTSESVEILNMDRALKLCTSCPNRLVERTDDGVPYCIKSK